MTYSSRTKRYSVASPLPPGRHRIQIQAKHRGAEAVETLEVTF